jgi:hypothetical protein
MRTKFASLLFLTLAVYPVLAQQETADTVIVPLAESSKIIFTVGNPEDLETLRHYNFQGLFEDILDRLEETAKPSQDSSSYNQEEADAGEIKDSDQQEDDAHIDHDGGKWVSSRKGKVGETWQSYNIDLGTNNYLLDDQFPTGTALYAVRPWGSWYVAGNSVQRTKLGRNFFVEWGLGVSWYTFKFQEDNTVLIKDESGVHFSTDTRNVDYIKSKLSATFINASLVPVLDFGGHSRKPRVWDGHGGGFRFGIGPYVGYRIASKTKLVYEEDGEREKEKDRDNFYLNNLRYGFRVQIGVRSTDLFINYDMNDLFATDKGPKLNAVSFGLIL